MSYVLPPFGLKNTGVICHLNSFIQALISCTSVTKFFLNNEKRFITEKNVVAIEYINLLKQVTNNLLKKSNNILDPVDLFNSIVLKTHEKYPNKKFGRGQEDSGEGLHLFLDAIDDIGLYKLFTHTYTSTIWCINCDKQVCKNYDNSIQFEVSKNYNPLKTLNKSNHHSLNNYLYQYVNSHPDYTCKLCGVKKCCSVYQLSRIPEIITIMFVKFQEKYMAEFPKYMYFPNTTGYLKFKIVATIEQSGNMKGGHYWSHGLRKEQNEEKMFVLNDSSYTEKCDMKASPSTYFVIYHYIGDVLETD
jgi:ubiquitin C-terminal hydrolase